MIQTLYQHQPGTIWIGTFQGLSKFDTSTENFTHYVPDADSPNTLPDHRIFSVLIDRHNHLWVGTANGLAKA
ncbi:MAG: hypothetical protein GWN30_16425, partial [Gammaproteobacteria bacterium]|nr:hypothetical protein [Gammaproteobacteria bacterium]NIW97000.1 hypothetical protein [Phycisphaerae bacterium]